MLEPGQIFANRYRVLRHIAEGGMGAIFEAEHTATERKVALKLLFPHIMSVASARKKFELEARISARVGSPNIVEVLDAGFDEASKSPFLVMELLEGQTLCHHVRERGPLSIDQALPLLSQVAAGLDAAHGYKEASGAHKPIVHRDLKPENLFLAREHGNVVVKILDFGIAKVLGETGNISQEVRGTPLYMAFEQVTAGALSPQTDIWALGLITYHLLTASCYWRSANEPDANVQSLFAEILTLPLEPPSVRMRQQGVSVVLPPAFDSWLLECIQREPARRFASAGAAIDALARAFGKPSPGARSKTQSMRPRALAMAETEAFTPPAQPAAIGATPAAPAQATALQPVLSRPAQLGTAASLPGMVSEHASLPVPAPTGAQARSWYAPAAAAAVVLLGGVGWLLSSGTGAHDAGGPAAGANAAVASPTVASPVSAAPPVPSAALPSQSPARPAEPAAPAAVPSVAVAPASDTPAAEAAPPRVSVAPAELAVEKPAAPGDEAPGEPARAPEAARPTPASTASSSASEAAPASKPAAPARATRPAPASVPRKPLVPERAAKKQKNSDAYRMR